MKILTKEINEIYILNLNTLRTQIIVKTIVLKLIFLFKENYFEKHYLVKTLQNVIKLSGKNLSL